MPWRWGGGAVALGMTSTVGITTHQGSCHCGAVLYEAELDLSQPVIACNCSMCGRAGTLLAFIPATAFRLLSGEDSLRDYQFNKHIIHHLFCTTCGTKPFARGQKPDGTPTVAINVRCLQDVDLSALSIHNYDGKSH